MSRRQIGRLTRMALLVALEVVLSRFLSIQSPYGKIGFAFLPLALSGALFGPWGGVAVGTVADLLGATLFPSGAFFPGFTLTTALKGAVFGLLFREERPHQAKIFAAVSLNALVMGLGLNTLWLSWLYNTSYMALIPTRLAQELVVIPLQTVLLCLLTRSSLIPRVNK